jgi:4-hydroxy-3-polyprenylbenzoate decarboxylase
MRELVVGISGASGAIYGIRLLEALREVDDLRTHLVISSAARSTIDLETDFSVSQVAALADETYGFRDVAARISSGSFKTIGMVIIPCSMRSLAGVACSYSDNLLLRAADVTLKDNRQLVLAVRESPIHLGHARLIVQTIEMGAQIMPLMPAFYHQPKTIDDLINQSVNRVADLLGVTLNEDLFLRWQGRNSVVTS